LDHYKAIKALLFFHKFHNFLDLDGLKSKPASTCHNQGLQNHAEENELKTTPEFRNHVAKKLQHYLDR